MTIEAREITARGPGGVSVVSVRGAGALERVRALAAPRASRLGIALGKPEFVRLSIGGEDLDEALVCALSESDVEVHLHGSPPLVRALLAHFGSDSANSSVTLSSRVSPVSGQSRASTPEARALELLASAPCPAAARILLDQAEGALRRDLEQAARVAGHAPQETAAILRALAERGRVAAFALEPARVVLSGRVNAGKSTLFNALVGEHRAVVSDVPGTTRDVVREQAQLGAYPVELVDTAGERDLEGPDARFDPSATEIEREGQRRARAEVLRADIVLWLEPIGSAAEARVRGTLPPAGCVHLVTCADRAAHPPPDAVSALRAPDRARERVAALFRERLRLPEDPWTPGAGVPFDPELRHVIAAGVAGQALWMDALQDSLHG